MEKVGHRGEEDERRFLAKDDRLATDERRAENHGQQDVLAREVQDCPCVLSIKQ